MMKVLFLVNLPSPYRALFFAELGKHCDLTVIYERESASDRNEKWKTNTEPTYRAIFLNGRKIGADNSFCPEILNYLKKEKYDKYVIGMYSTYTAMLTIEYFKVHNIPFYLSTDGGFIQSDSFIRRKIKRHYISAASWWLCPSDKAIEYFTYYGADKTKIYKYPFSSVLQKDIVNPSEITIELKRIVRKKLMMEEQQIVLAIGQFIHRKGFDILLEAMKNLPSTIGVYIVGGKPTDEYIKLKERFSLDNVHFIDFKTKNEIRDYYLAADLFVHPTREDIWGLVINEAISFCLPVITTTKCLAGIELVEQGVNGYIVPVEDSTQLEKTIEVVLKADREKMSEASYKKAINYTIESMAQRHLDIFVETK